MQIFTFWGLKGTFQFLLTKPNFLQFGSRVPELEDPEKWHFLLKAFIALTTVLRYRADCDVYYEM